MALVVLLRGVNVGGHRTFRPRVVAEDLKRFDVVNVGAAGTFVVRRPGTRAEFRAALLERLPFVTHVMFCSGTDLLRLEANDPYRGRPARPDVVRFVSFLGSATHLRRSLPIALPAEGPWLVRVVALKHRLAVGEYRRDMRTIGYLGQLDQLFGAPATTRNWNTITAIKRVLEDGC